MSKATNYSKLTDSIGHLKNTINRSEEELLIANAHKDSLNSMDKDVYITYYNSMKKLKEEEKNLKKILKKNRNPEKIAEQMNLIESLEMNFVNNMSNMKKIRSQCLSAYRKIKGLNVKIKDTQKEIYLREQRLVVYEKDLKKTDKQLIVEEQKLLKKIDKLPVDIIKYIEEYLPYRTRVELLEKRIKILNYFKLDKYLSHNLSGLLSLRKDFIDMQRPEDKVRYITHFKDKNENYYLNIKYNHKSFCCDLIAKKDMEYQFNLAKLVNPKWAYDAIKMFYVHFKDIHMKIKKHYEYKVIADVDTKEIIEIDKLPHLNYLLLPHM